MACKLTNPFAWVIFTIMLLLTNSAGAAEGRKVRSLLEMRQENVIVQKYDLSCGAAVLATLLNNQYGDPVTEKEVAQGLIKRAEYIDSPKLVQMQEGFSLLDLKRYVNSRGYQGIGYGKLTIDDLVKKAPIIVPINANGYNHFVIFRGIVGNRVLLADPAWGNRTMLIDKFDSLRLDYPSFGKVGFVVAQHDGTLMPNRMAPRQSDFVILR